jgi:hypothetical protein
MQGDAATGVAESDRKSLFVALHGFTAALLLMPPS